MFNHLTSGEGLERMKADGPHAEWEDSWTASSGAVFKDPNIVAVFYASQIKIA